MEKWEKTDQISGHEHGYTVVLNAQLPVCEDGYRDTPLPEAPLSFQSVKEQLPERLREMRRLFRYGPETPAMQAESFYRQAVFMEDYTDDVPWSGDFRCYYPTYQDLTTRQLRGYFTWRTHVRRGVFEPIACSAAYIYIYELLNGIGADSPADSLQKLKEFESGFLDRGLGDARMRINLRRWMLEYAVISELPEESALQAADPEMIRWDAALSVLRTPDVHPDEEVFRALCFLGGKKTEKSPVLANDPERGRRLFCDVWRAASADRRCEKDLFTRCFGVMYTRPWHPLFSALYHERSVPEDRDYVLSDSRSYHCRDGLWQMKAFEKLSFDRRLLQGFLRETDARLRRYLKTGRYLRENPADEWVIPFADAVIESDRKVLIEAAKPKITIDLSRLARIRSDAVITRDSLLTEEERGEEAHPAAVTRPVSEENLLTREGREKDVHTSSEEKPSKEETSRAAVKSGADAVLAGPEDGTDRIPLDQVQIRILRALLRGQDVTEIIRETHQLPSVVADAVNEAFFDRIGDTVLISEDDRLILAEDYISDIEQLLEGAGDGGT